MGRLQDIAEGTRAIKRIDLPLVNTGCALTAPVPELVAHRARAATAAPEPQQSTISVGLRVLLGSELVDVQQRAEAFARAHGVEKPDEENPIYSLAMSVYTCAVACVDPDDDPAAPRPFFGILEPGASWTIDLAAEHILNSPHLGRDGIMWLAEQHEFWQDQNNPGALKMSPDLCWRMVGEVASDETGKRYFQLRPAARWIFTHFMAVLLSSSLTGKLPSGFTFAALQNETEKRDPGADKPS